MHFIVVANDAALSVREFFLEDEVLLDLYPLSDGGSLNLGTRCFLALWDPLESTCRHASLSIL